MGSLEDEDEEEEDAPPQKFFNDEIKEQLEIFRQNKVQGDSVQNNLDSIF